MKGFKKLLCVFLSIAMVVTSLTVVAIGDDGYTEVSTAAALQGAFVSGAKAKLRLANDITLTAELTGQANDDITIDLNGYKLTAANGKRVYYSSTTSSKVTIEDSVGTGKAISGVGSATTSGDVLYPSGTINITGGTYVGGSASQYGSAIYTFASSGTPHINVSGGTFVTTTGSGAMIYAGKGTICNITGGIIGYTSGNNRSFWAYGTGAKLSITGDAYIQGTANLPGSTYLGTITGGYYSVNRSSQITDKTNYKQITLPEKKEGCLYKITKNNATIKYFDGDTEYTTLGGTQSAGSTSTIAAAQTKTDYNFVSWNTQADGEGDTYQAGAEFFVEGDLTLYAQWVSATATTYDIKYYDGDDEYTELAETVEEGEKFNIEDAQEKTNYIFKEWNTSKTGDGTSYAAGQEITASEDLTLYAQWNKAVAKVVCNGDTTYYDSFTKAITAEIAATSNGASATITLMDNVTLSSKIIISSNLNDVSKDTTKRTTTIDFNGYTITTSSADAFSINKYSKLNFYDNSSAGTGGVVMSNAAARLVYSPGWSGTQFSVYGGNYSGLVKISNYGYNTHAATRLYGGSFNTLSCGDGVSPLVPNETGAEKIGDTYCVGKAVVTVDGTTKVFTSFESARAYLVANNDEGETGTIKLLGNVAVSSRIALYSSWSSSNAKRTVIFDLNGKTLSSTKAISDGIITQNCYDVTYIKDSSTAKTGKITMYEGSGYYFHTPRYTTNMYYISDVTLSGGSQLGPDSALGSTTYYKIESGTFSFDPSPYMTDKTKTALDNGDGTWTIIDAPYIATYSDETQAYFATYQLALDSILAKSDLTGTIKVAVPKVDATFALDKEGADITIDLNGQSVAMSTNIPFADVKAGYLTIENGTIDLEGKTDDAAKINVAEGSVLYLNDIAFSGGTDPIITSYGIVKIDGAVAINGVVDQKKTTVVAENLAGTVSDEIAFTLIASVAAPENAKVTMKYISNGEEKETAGEALGDGEYKFVTEVGILLTSLDEDLEMTFYVDGEKASDVINMSVQDYFELVYAQEPDNNSQNAFMAEALDFGKKLQEYKYNESTIVLSDWQTKNLVKIEPTATDNRKATLSKATSSETDKIASAYIYIENKADLRFNIRTSADTRIEITLGKNLVYDKAFSYGGTKLIVVEGVSPADYDEDVIVTLYSGANVLHQIRYSVNSYAYAKMNDAKAGDAVKAMYCYGVAGEAYKLDGEVEFADTYYSWSNYSTTCTATRKSTDGKIVQTETVNVVKTTKTAESGVVAAVEVNTADFVNPSFATQVTTAPKVKEANLTGSKTQTAYEKHLILNSDGSYGGSYDKDTYGAGAPKNGANDHVDAGYYAINDYFNTKCTSTRTILTGFKPYQQTMEYTDGIASVLMALNYYDDTFASTYSEKDLLDKYEELNSATVYGNGTTGAGLKALVENYGYKADTTATAGDKASFQTLVENTLKDGKIMLLRWQQADKSRWVVVVGFDGMGNNENNSDVLILGVPYDAYDHYQDGYQVQTITTFYAWWKVQTTTGIKSSHDIVIISPNEPITLQYETGADNIKTNPYTPERHLLLNSNGTTGGATNTSLYGSGTAYNGTYGGRYTDAPEYNYYAKKDYYNAVDTASLKICENFAVFEQTMASSCGICSTLNTLNYLGYDFEKLDNYVTDRPTQSGYVVGSIHKGGNYEKVQEALLNIYMQGDTYFDDASHKFNNYGGVGAWRLIKIGQKLGLTGTYSNFDVGEKETPKFTTFTSFKNYIQDRLDNNLPLIICWCPGSGHWETIIGYDDMGTDTVNDDVIVLADSADSHDQYQDGYNTYPARQFFAQWYNGTASLGQPMVAYDAITK